MKSRMVAAVIMAATMIGGMFATTPAEAMSADRAEEMWRKREEDTRRIPREFSKIRLKIAIAQIGKLAELEAWLASFEVAPGYSALDAWNDAQVISDDFEGFSYYYEAAKLALGVDDATAEAIIAASVAQ